ncbi:MULTISPECIES: peptide ABC transporter substrate-binding protein [unclassified Enterococcus]|uniref:peptide ABC transporter substrate-binding protein n=1 Tax=unclassified Enterococcus TaxID=2608891 RepID=UPI001CE142F0|nr:MULTISPECIES: peptide ABC transporter substrate-binding protein [unclassified Enterococcus]MCA5013859.1 peptide ABC transporter substrate-binding protein [Enterococcus sp. S23]MCA5017367.1 peptide ABC transporter substrate-binding protein [Enterococcus sp. S22(2020)]
MKKIIQSIIVMTVMVTIISGCSGTKHEDAAKPTPLRLMSASELTTLDTSVMLDFPDAIVQTAAFEGLYALDDKDQLIPAAAKEMPEISEDGKTYTIKLREDAKWSNDDPVTAKDFEYAWKKMIDPENGYVYSFLVKDTILNAEDISDGKKPVEELGVKAIDDQTLEVKLKEAKPYFTSVLAFPTFFPQNQKVVEELGTDYGTTSENVVYNGPFIVENWKQTDLSWDLKKNENYWDYENVKSDSIHYEVIKEASTALNLFEDGQLDVATITGELAKQNQSNPDYHSYPTATMNYIRLNQKRKGKDTPLKNENLRKALALGIDKENLVNNIIADGSKPLYGAVTEGFVSNPETGVDFREEAGDLMTYDEKAALSYWEQAKKELGDNITIDLMVTDDGSYKKMGESLQGNLEKLFPGLTINVTALPTETALNLSRESDYDMFLIYWTPDYQDPISTLNMLRSGNDRNYSNPTYDALLDDASQKYATELQKRWETLIAAEKEAIEETAGMIIISQNQQSVLQNPQVKGLSYHTFAAPLTLKNVYKETK